MSTSAYVSLTAYKWGSNDHFCIHTSTQMCSCGRYFNRILIYTGTRSYSYSNKILWVIRQSVACLLKLFHIVRANHNKMLTEQQATDNAVLQHRKTMHSTHSRTVVHLQVCKTSHKLQPELLQPAYSFSIARKLSLFQVV